MCVVTAARAEEIVILTLKIVPYDYCLDSFDREICGILSYFLLLPSLLKSG